MQNPEIAVQCFVQGLRLYPEADNLWSTLFLTCMNFLAENETLGQAAANKDLKTVLTQVQPAKRPASPESVDKTIDSIKAKLLTQ
jgi:hypothetical protein